MNLDFYLRGSGSVWARRLDLALVAASVPVTQDSAPYKAGPIDLMARGA